MTIQDIQLTSGRSSEKTRRQIEWLKAHGVDPFHVPVSSVVRWLADVEMWEVESYVKNPSGGLMVDASNPPEPLKVKITFPPYRDLRGEVMLP